MHVTSKATMTNLEELQRAWMAGDRPKFVMFWGHSVEADGRITAACLSQWFPSPFTVDGVPYATAEHWMMASKARLFGDREMLDRILEARSPAEAKKLGGMVRGFDEQTWRSERFAIVTTGNLHKFGQNGELCAFLRTTGTKVLVEASPVDRIWGIGLAKDAPEACDPLRWRGLNLLGFALMEARKKL